MNALIFNNKLYNENDGKRHHDIIILLVNIYVMITEMGIKIYSSIVLIFV
jgi:hypothetical protein